MSPITDPKKTQEATKAPPIIRFHYDTEEGPATFTAEESDGYSVNSAGFFLKKVPNWIVSELTILFGTEEVEDKEGKGKKFERKTIHPSLFINQNGERKVVSLLTIQFVDFDGKRVSLEGRTLVSTSLHTLMSKETAEKFLRGDNASIEEIYPKLVLKFKRFVDCEWDKKIYDVLICYAIATHFFDVFKAIPGLYLFGSYGSGKGRAGKSVAYSSHRGINVVDPSDASFYRMVEGLRPTLFFEEILRFYDSFRLHLRASYKKGSRVPRIERTKNGQYILKLFEQFCPTIITSTKLIRESETEEAGTESRTVRITMRKANDPNPEKQDPEETDFDEERNSLYLARLTQAKEVSDVSEQLNGDSKVQQVFKSRDWEIWRPLLTVAKMAGEEVFNNVLSFASEYVKEKSEEEYEDEKKMIRGIETLLLGKINPGEVSFTPKILNLQMFDLFKEDFGLVKENFDKVYNARRLGCLLKRMGLKRKRISGGSEYKITSIQLEELKTRFGYVSEASLPSPNMQDMQNMQGELLLENGD